ncbi:MAG TPA: portal protein [Acidiferrobacterales bacterium]|nr:portal protein [Acidiferrobacterales bacterium]
MASIDPRIEQEVAAFQMAAGERGTWDSHWEEIARMVLPSFSGSFTSNGESQTPGSKRTQHLYDSTAPIALPRFAAVMESMLTPRGTKWHRLAPVEPALMKDRSVRLWLDEATDLLFRYRYAPSANFSGQNHQTYLGLGAFGTGPLFIDQSDAAPGLRYRAIHLGEIYFFENHQGVIDKAKRRIKMSPRQCLQKFGEAALPDGIKNKLGRPEQDKPTETILHCVYPREDVMPGRLDYRGKAFVSRYIALDYKVLLREGGYNTFPFAIGRHTLYPGEVYGRSPAMEALPAIKTINEEKKTMLKQGQRTVDPVLLAFDDGIVDGFSLKAGAINAGAVSRDGRPLVHTLPTGNLMAGDKMMELERIHIQDAFLTSLFQILTDRPQATATEIIELTREKGVLLSPTMGRQQSEYLGPMIDREIDVLQMQRLLPPMPPALREAGGEYKVEYDSPLSRAQRSEEASGFLRMMELSLKIATEAQDPGALDWANLDVAMPELADINAVPTRWTNSAQQKAQIRAGRQQAQQTQDAINAAPAVSALLKNAPQGVGI